MSIIVPVLNEASLLPGLLDHLSRLGGPPEVVVVDGGSSDGTVGVAREHPLSPPVLEERGGRGRQLNAGARTASGDVLLFLHADTHLPEEAWCELRTAVRDPSLGGGNFALRYDGQGAFRHVLEAWRRAERRLGVYYGDSAIFCRREVFEALGGYAPQRVMEDYEFARRLECRYRTTCLSTPVVTSGRRWETRGVVRTVITWNAIRWLYLAGVPERRLARLYRRRR